MEVPFQQKPRHPQLIRGLAYSNRRGTGVVGRGRIGLFLEPGTEQERTAPLNQHLIGEYLLNNRIPEPGLRRVGSAEAASISCYREFTSP